MLITFVYHIDKKTITDLKEYRSDPIDFVKKHDERHDIAEIILENLYEMGYIWMRKPSNYDKVYHIVDTKFLDKDDIPTEVKIAVKRYTRKEKIKTILNEIRKVRKY